MSERTDRIHKIAEANFSTVNRVRKYCEKAAFPSISSLAEPDLAGNMVAAMVDGMLRFPSRIEIKGMTLDKMDIVDRQRFAQNVQTQGAVGFIRWYNEHIGGKINPEVIKKIIDRNMDHFVEAWYENNGKKFPEPDWEKMTASENSLLNDGRNENLYGLYVRLFNGLQLSAMEIFIEDTAPPNFPDSYRAKIEN